MTGPDRPILLFVEPSYASSYGGSKRVLVNVLRHLDTTRWDLRALFYRPGPYLEDLNRMGIQASAPEALGRLAAVHEQTAQTKGVPSVGLRRGADGARRRHPVRRLVRDLRAYSRFWGRDRRTADLLLEHVPPDTALIQINNPLIDEQAWYHVARRLQVPYLTWEHGIWREPTGPYRRVVLDAASVICLTPERATLLRQTCGAAVRPEVVANGMDVRNFQPHRSRDEVRRELEVGPQTLMLSTAGHYKRWKGQHLALEAAAGLQRAGVDFRWFFFGQRVEPRYFDELHDRVRELGLQAHVSLLEQRDDVADLFAATDLAVHTSVQPEPFGMVVIEAMSVGTPVVGPREGAIPAIVRNGIDGALYQPRDADSLASTIRGLAADRPRLREMGEQARARVLAEFDVRTQVSRLTEIYARVLAPAEEVPAATRRTGA